MAALTLEHLSVGYTHNRHNVPIMGVINAELAGGELVALIGANGAGKSTLLRTLSGFMPPLGGSITYPDGKPGIRTASELSTQLSVVLTGNGNIHGLTVREVVALGRTPYTGFLGRRRRHDDDIVERAMEQVNISHLAHRRIDALSDGERQKAMIAKALTQETPVMILDEPTAFLDFGSRVELFRLLQKSAHHDGKAVLVSTHDIELALQLADKLWLIHQRCLYSGSVDELVDNGIFLKFIEADGIHYNIAEKKIEISSL
ncbi:MAG: ABC transporter ATP-binding protein [Bacteroidaceae bacterium]|nr:ABC transporter ATP-binding protein [Bacteroidaceae bacterium]